MAKKLISIVTPCYNEEGNVKEIYMQVQRVMKPYLKKYSYEHIFVDNASTDTTVKKLREISRKDAAVKVIINTRNFGWMRSTYNGIMSARGDAVIQMCADLQEPPSVIPAFIEKWEAGFPIAIGVKNKSKENRIMFFLRKIFYALMKKFSDVDQIKNFTGFGLYDKKVINVLRSFNEVIPYFRGMICETGFKRAEIEYVQPKRAHGTTKFNFYRLYDLAMLGFINYSVIPIRFAIFLGFVLSFLSGIFGVIMIVQKILFWNQFVIGLSSVIVGVFFFSSVQLFFIGILGEYVISIHSNVKKRPWVVEAERINFEK